ncbi:MAG: MFS transporter [Chlamydiota bacterium]
MHKEKKQRPLSLFPILLTYFLDNFGLAVIYPIFTPIFLSPGHLFFQETATFFQRTLLLGLLIGCFPLAQFFGAPLIGQYSDRAGRKKAFVISILGTGVGYTITALAILYYSLPFLFVGRLCTGLFAGNLTLCLASIADGSPDEESRTKNFGLIAAIGGLSFIIAIATGGILSDPQFSFHFNPSFPFWITACLTFINLFFIITLYHETRPARKDRGFNPFHGVQNIRAALQLKNLRVIYVINFLFMLAWVGSMQFFPTFMIKNFHYQITLITVFLMVVGFIWSTTNFAVNRALIKRFHPGQTLMYSLLFLGVLLSAILFVHNPFPFFTLFFISVGFASLCWTNGMATISLKAPKELQGSILGINQSMVSVASMASPVIGGLLAGISIHSVYIFSGIISLIAYFLLRKNKRQFATHR